ncbi:DNA polymerase III subunit delta' [Lichenifustis flavocetrariae]|uniref:DNA polymerase III subunit delta n=1 Tax=Lichenifustis flavocetrariae TaxID=2949735 RepID=A0AA41YV22_9HYPH|nr:DNA polymerase III subunit delta' [Lichenifustis flavocetrariae]MCW6507612.1 DNA polymerase III subunit delta' [Lichenifustis flavocetrariae]
MRSPARMEQDEDEGPRPPWRTTGLVGHGPAEQHLLDAYRTERLHHAWLIGGPAGIGKATLAWRFARFLLTHSDPRARAVQEATTLAVTPEAPAAQRIAAGSHGDVVALRREWNEKTKKLFSEIRVDDVRRALGLFQNAAGAGGYRVCIIDSAEDLNRSSANALLKIIEEPPPRSLFMILAHRPGQVMPTLVSRCRRLTLAALSDDEVIEALDGLGDGETAMPDERLRAAAARSQGSVAEALRLLGGDALDLDQAVRQVLDRLPNVDWRSVHRLADTVGFSDDRFALMIEALFDEIAARLRRGAAQGQPTADLARLAGAWERVRVTAREASVLNLDKRPVLLSIMAELAEATPLSR